MPTLKGLIFDLDGTLLDSAPDLRHAVNATLADYGLSPLDLDQIAGMTGDGMLTLLSRAFAMAGRPIDTSESYAVFQKFIDHYRVLKPDPSQIYHGVIALLTQAQKHNIAMGVCTNKQEAETHRLLADLAMDKFFAFVAGGDTYPVHKPHADHVLGVMRKLQVEVENCVMIGDSSNDVLAAKNAGMLCIGVTHGYGAAALIDLGANILVDGFAKIPDALSRLGFSHPLL